MRKPLLAFQSGFIGQYATIFNLPKMFAGYATINASIYTFITLWMHKKTNQLLCHIIYSIPTFHIQTHPYTWILMHAYIHACTHTYIVANNL